jgi:hypothetical protein
LSFDEGYDEIAAARTEAPIAPPYLKGGGINDWERIERRAIRWWAARI